MQEFCEIFYYIITFLHISHTLFQENIMNSCELVTLVSFLSCLISNSYDNEELAVLAAVFTQLGDSLATILANKDLLYKKCP